MRLQRDPSSPSGVYSGNRHLLEFVESVEAAAAHRSLGSGVTREDFRGLLERAVGASMRDEEANAFFKLLDTDSDGKIDAKELEARVTARKEQEDAKKGENKDVEDKAKDKTKKDKEAAKKTEKKGKESEEKEADSKKSEEEGKSK